MSSKHAILAILAVSLLGMYACKSTETTSAVLHNEHGQYQLAIAQAKKALEKSPNDAEAHFQLGISYSETGDMVGAYREFQTAARLDPRKRNDAETGIRSNWAKHFNNGLSVFQTDNLSGAAVEFELATQADPRQVKAWLNLTKVYYQLSHNDSTYTPRAYEAVDTLLAKTSEKDEQYANVLALAGRVMVKRGMKDQAVAIFQKLLLDDPANYEEVESAGGDYLAERDWVNGALFLQMAVDARKKTNSEDFESYYNLGVAYFNAKDCPKAIDAYLSALAIDAESKQGNYSLFLAYFTCEMFNDAILQGQKYTEKWPDDANGWRVLSLCYGKKGMKMKAEEAAKKYQELAQ